MSIKTTRSAALACVLSSMITGVALSAAARADTTDASVTVPSDVARVAVRYHRDSLETSAGVHTLYRRIMQAAEQVCPDAAGDPRGLNAAVRACRAASVARAVQSIDSPRLAALYEATQKRG
jgi:UrcA family protein